MSRAACTTFGVANTALVCQSATQEQQRRNIGHGPMRRPWQKGLGARLGWANQRRAGTICTRFNQTRNGLAKSQRLAGATYTKVTVAKGKYLNLALYGTGAPTPAVALPQNTDPELATATPA